MHLQVKGSELDSLIAIEIANLLEQVRVREEKGNRDVDGEREGWKEEEMEGRIWQYRGRLLGRAHSACNVLNKDVC